MVAAVKAVWCAMVLLLSSGFFAQEQAAQRIPRLLLAVENRSVSAFSEAERAVTARSVAFALQSAEKRMAVIDYGSAVFPESRDERAQECARLRADGWLWIGLSGEKTAPILFVECFDIGSERMLLSTEMKKEQELSLAELAEEKWTDIVKAVAAGFQGALHVSSETAATGAGTALVTIQALPGTVITGLPEGPLTVGEDGKASRRVPVPNVYTIRGAVAGYSPVTIDFYLLADRKLSLPQKPAPRWAFDASGLNALFPGGAVSFHMIPNWLFARFDAVTYLVGLQLRDESFLYSMPLFNFRLGAGGYMTPEDFPIRPYAAAGGFLRICWLAGFLPEVEPISPGGMFLEIGAEIPVMEQGRLFIEYSPMDYLTGFPELFLASLGDEGNRTGYLITPVGVLSLLNFRFGFRWLL